ASLLLTAGLPVLMCIACRHRKWRFALTLAILLGIAIVHVPGGGRAIQVRRTFFGVHRIVQLEDGRMRELYHGATLHGRQRYDLGGRSVDEPLTYYHRSGPAGDVLTLLPHDRTAAVGLGVGSVAAYAREKSKWTFYEIDREVLWAAEES